MTIDNNGILSNSSVAQCENYNPDKSRPTGVKAHDILRKTIYECFNREPTEKGKDLKICNSTFCLNHKLKEE